MSDDRSAAFAPPHGDACHDASVAVTDDATKTPDPGTPGRPGAGVADDLPDGSDERTTESDEGTAEPDEQPAAPDEPAGRDGGSGDPAASADDEAVAGAATGYEPLTPPEPRGPAAWAGPLVVALLAAATYVTYSVLQWRRFESPSWDLGIFTQLARRYADLEAPVVTIKGDGFNLLGDHFHPLLVLLGVPYRIAPSALTLLVVQGLLLAFSVLVVGREAARVLGALQGTFVAAAYTVSFGLVGAVASQFHEIAFAVPLLALSLVAFLRERWWASALWAAPLVLVKEDLGLTVAALGAVMWWRMRRRHAPQDPLLGAWLALWGMTWVVLSTTVLLPALNTADQYDYGSRIDFGAIVTHPWTAVTLLVDDGSKVLTLVMLVAITGFVGLRSPVLLIAVPTILWRFYADIEYYHGYRWHYSAVLMPIAFAALLDGVLLTRLSPRRWLRRYSFAAAPVAVAVAAMFVPQLDLARLGRPDDLWAPSHRAVDAQGLLDRIPEGSTVETDIGLMSYLVDDHDVFYVGNDDNPPPDYLVIDTLGGGWGPAPSDVAQYAMDRHPGTTFEIVYDAGGYQLAQRTG